MDKEFDDFINDVISTFGKGSIQLLNDESIVTDIDTFTTGSLELDNCTGIGGFPRGRITEMYGGESSGKAQPLHSKVLTPYGWKNMGDLEIGSIISSPSGGTSTVLGIFPQGVQDTYRVTLDDGTSTLCTLDHLWSVKTRGSELWNTLSLSEILDIGIVSNSGTRKFRIPKVSPIEFSNETKLPLDPWFMGILLGDGSLRGNNVTYTTVDKEISDRVEKIITTDFKNLKVKKSGRDSISYRFSKLKNGSGKNALTKIFEKYGMLNHYSYEKFIPREYLYSSVENRIKLLRGLMDSDGTISGGSDNICSASFTTTSPQLRDDFTELARGLGYRASISYKKSKYRKSDGSYIDGRPAWAVNIILGEELINPFSLTRKAERVVCDKSKFQYRYIVSIEKEGREQVQCIKVSDPNSLYITDDYIVTHNTTLAIHAMADCTSQGLRALVVDVEHAFDRNYAEALGVDSGLLYISQPDNGEDALEIVERAIKSGKFGIIVLDSVGGMVTKKEIDADLEDHNMAPLARLMSKSIKKLTHPTRESNTAVIFLNQMRTDLSGYIIRDKPMGGNALKFYASLRIELRSQAKSKNTVVDKQHVKGLKKAVVIKNKLAPPFRECEFTVEFGKGVDKTPEYLEDLVRRGIIVRKGGNHYFKEERIATKKVDAIQFIEDNPEFVEQFYK